MEELEAALVRDHIVGLELELVEVVERHHRAEVQGGGEDAEQLQRRIDALHVQLAQTAEVIASQR